MKRDLIKQLQSNPDIYAECPDEGGSFPFRGAIMFYVDEPVPEKAQRAIETMKQDVGRVQAVADKELALSYLLVGMYEEAREGFLKMLEEKADDAESWLMLGQVFINLGDLDNAIEAFDHSIAGKAGGTKPVIDAWAHNLAGHCLDMQGKREAAIAHYCAVVSSGVNMQGAADTARKYLKIPYRKQDNSERN